MENFFKETFSDTRLSVKNLWISVFTGDFRDVFFQLKDWIRQATIGELLGNKGLLQAFFLFFVMAVLVKYLSILFHGSQTVELTRYILSICLLSSSLYAFYLGLEIGEKCIAAIYEIAKISIPIYLISMSVAHSLTMASAFSQIFVLAITVLVKVISAILLPFLGAIEVLKMLDHALLDKRLSSAIGYCEKLVMFCMRGFIGGISAFGFIQSNVLSASASVRKNAMGVVTALIPGAGQLAEESMALFIGSSTMIFRSMGALVMVLILLVTLFPFLQLILLLFTLRLEESLMGVVGDDMLQRGLKTAGESIVYLIRVIFGTVSLFLLMIAVALLGAR